MKHTTKRTLRLLAILGLIVALLMSSVTALAASDISKAQAKSIALKKAGLTSSKVTKWTKVKLDNWDKDNDREWDVEFQANGYKYEVEINAKTGKIEDYERSKIHTAQTTKKLSKEEAKAVALKKAGVSGSDVKKWTKAKLDGNEWEFKFQTSQYKYEVEVNAKTGKVKDYERKKIATSSGTTISKDKAKSIALQHAKTRVKISGSVKYTKVKLDKDDGVRVYDVEFRYKGTEFEYEINANTGKIIEWDIDRDD